MSKYGAISMYESLIDSLDKAGGTIPIYELLNMSVRNLLETLGPNRIRFIYVDEKEEKKKK